VIVTALNDPEKKQEALSNGAEDYVLKPDLLSVNRTSSIPRSLADGQRTLKCMEHKCS
jgi:CheY-like chemotaxis protein